MIDEGNLTRIFRSPSHSSDEQSLFLIDRNSYFKVASLLKSLYNTKWEEKYLQIYLLVSRQMKEI